LKKNVLIIGAGGGVGRAFIHRIGPDRNKLGKLVLVDRDEGLPADPLVPHALPEYDFVHADVDERNQRDSYEELLRRHNIHIVIDLSVNETRALLEVTNDNGVSYLNTGIANRVGENFYEAVLDVVERKKSRTWRAPHILCAGMNPGIVNMWVRSGIERFGVPRSIIHFEYDRGRPLREWLPIITWSRETFVDEVSNDPAGSMAGRGRVRYLYPNPLKNRIPMRSVLRPIMNIASYPRGFLLLHEENITIAQEYDVSSRFLFAIDLRTMDYLEALYDEAGSVSVDAVTLGDNRKVLLKGAVTIGTLLEYGESKVYFFNTTRHEGHPGFSGSCWQVSAGLHAALFTLLGQPLRIGIHFMEDLFGTLCEKMVAENLPMQEIIVPPG